MRKKDKECLGSGGIPGMVMIMIMIIIIIIKVYLKVLAIPYSIC